MRAIWLSFFVESIMDIKSRDQKSFIQRRDAISRKKLKEKLGEFEYFGRSNLPCATDDAADVMSEPKLNWTSTISLRNR